MIFKKYLRSICKLSVLLSPFLIRCHPAMFNTFNFETTSYLKITYLAAILHMADNQPIPLHLAWHPQRQLMIFQSTRLA